MSEISYENTVNILPEEFNITCRCCLKKSGEIELFLYHHDGVPLSEIIMVLSLVHIEQNDELPKSLCQSCVNLAEQFYIFKKQIEKSDNFLKNLIKKKPISKDVSDVTVEDSKVILNNFLKHESIISDLPELNKSINIESKLNEANNCTEIKITGCPDSHSSKYIRNSKNIKISKKLNNFTCTFCNLKFDNVIAYRAHRKKEADQRRKKQTCSVCHKMISTYKLKDHLNSHTKERPYQCDICREKFRFRSSLTRHNFRHAQKKPHECTICGKGFIQAPALTDHIRTHSGEKAFICNVCGKSFITKHSLANHVYLHKINNLDDFSDLTCNKCNKSFSTKSGLKYHMTTHNNQKDFLCSFCGKKFSTNYLLDSHIKNHSSVKPFVCEICNKGFLYKNALQKHQLTHTGEKPEVCFICKKKFSQKSHLTHHLRKHSGERPYSCNFCNKTFDHTGSLKIHIRIHTGEKPFICNVCSKGFYDSSSLKKHIKKSHHEFDFKTNINLEINEKSSYK